MNDAGQCDVDDDEQDGFTSEAVIELAGRRIALRHILYESGKMTKDGQAFLEREQPDICIFGDTLLFNPGSAGPRRFSLPRGVGLLTVTEGKVMPRLIRSCDRVNNPTVGHLQERSKTKGAVR
jgi:predicted phosphodiesterase